MGCLARQGFCFSAEAWPKVFMSSNPSAGSGKTLDHLATCVGRTHRPPRAKRVQRGRGNDPSDAPVVRTPILHRLLNVFAQELLVQRSLGERREFGIRGKT